MIEPTPVTNLPPIQTPPQKPSPLPIILLTILVLVMLAGMGYLYLQNQILSHRIYLLSGQLGNRLELNQDSMSLPTTPSIAPTQTALSTPEVDPTASWKTYTNNYWNLTLKYPADKLLSCPGYTTEKEGVRFWDYSYTCPDGHDNFFIIGLIGYEPGKYIEPKTPVKTESITVGGKSGVKKYYTYDNNDGQLSSLKQSVSIVIQLKKGTIELQQLGDNPHEQQIFNQMLNTLTFE